MAISVAGVVFGPSLGVAFASKANAVLMVAFLALCASVCGCGTGAVHWSHLVASSRGWSPVVPSLPAYTQLLVYGDILPAMCQLLCYRTGPIRAALVLGSFLTLCFQIGWAGLGIALAPDPAAAGARSGPIRIPLFSFAIMAVLKTILESFLALLSTGNDVLLQRRGIEDPGLKLPSPSSRF